jgi:hypothetical protein
VIKLITIVLSIIGTVGKFFIDTFSAKARAKKKAVKDGKKAVDDNDLSDITRQFDRMR